MAVSEFDSIILRTLTDFSPQLLALSNHLCAHPELGRSEFQAHAALTSLLADQCFDVKPHYPCETGFVASHVGNERQEPHVALLCEYDALPEIGHACGHNLIAVVAVGAGMAVRAVMQEMRLIGRVSVFGTPAEETDGGKIDFINAGLFNDVDAALMAHPVGGKRNVANPRSTACASYRVVFHGKASHSSAETWETVNALDAAVHAYQCVLNLRQYLPPSTCITGVITEGGQVANVIPERSVLEFLMRTKNSRERAVLLQRWKQCTDSAAAVTGCEVQVTETSNAYDELSGSKCLASALLKHAKAVGVDMDDTCDFPASMDAGNVSQVIPTIHSLFGIKSKSNIHMRKFEKDASAETAFRLSIQQARLIALTAVQVLIDEELRRDMKNEFHESLLLSSNSDCKHHSSFSNDAQACS